MNPCNHIISIKLDKFKNSMNKYPFKNCNFKHNFDDINQSEKNNIWVCLKCGKYGCGRYSENQCILNHFKKEKHGLVVNPSNNLIWCYKCDEDVCNILNNLDNPNSKIYKEMDKKIEEIQINIFKNTKNNNKMDKNLEKKLYPDSFNQKVNLKKISENKVNIPPSSIFGLKNWGNTCFFNSVLQCLNACYELKNILGDNYNLIQKSKILESYFSLMKGNDQIRNPKPLLAAISKLKPMYRHYNQQDAQELLRYLIDFMNEKLIEIMNLKKPGTPFKPKRTGIENIFGFYLCNYVRCMNCKEEDWIFDWSFDLVIDLNKKSIIKKNSMNEIITNNKESDYLIKEFINEKKKYLVNQLFEFKTIDFEKNPIPNFDENKKIFEVIGEENFYNKKNTLGNYLDYFFDYEIINNKDNFYKCEYCLKKGANSKTNFNAFRKFYIFNLPKILTICLKRFKQSGYYSYSKNNIEVEYPEILDIKNYLICYLISE